MTDRKPYIRGTNRTGRPWERLRARVLRVKGDTCHLCGKPGADSADHVVPVSLGGAIYDINNVEPAHVACNQIRGNRPVAEAQRELQHRTPGWQPEGYYLTEHGCRTSRDW